MAIALLNQPQRKTCWLQILCTIIIVTKIKEGFLKKSERVKGFFIFTTMLLLKGIESNYSKKEPGEQGCSWMIKFSHYINFQIW